MNVRVFGVVLLLVGVVVLTVGGYMWLSGVPDDGRYNVQADDPLELISKNRALIERRQASRRPLVLGGIAVVVGGAFLLAARPRSTT